MSQFIKNDSVAVYRDVDISISDMIKSNKTLWALIAYKDTVYVRALFVFIDTVCAVDFVWSLIYCLYCRL